MYFKKILAILVIFLPIYLYSDPPFSVTDFSVSEVHWRQIKLTWTVPYSTSPILYYEIRVSTYRVLTTQQDWDNNSSENRYPYRVILNVYQLSGTTTGYLFTNLENNKTYFFAIKSSTSSDGKPLSDIDSNPSRPFATPQNSPPSQFAPLWPTEIVVVTSQTYITFDWEASYDEDTLYGDEVKYEFYYSTVSSALLDTTPPTFSGGQVWFISNITTSYLELSPYIFLDNTTYYWRVKAYDIEGGASWSYPTLVGKRPVFIVNHTPQPPNSFNLLKPSFASTTTYNLGVNFDWEDATDPDPNDAIFYSLYISSLSDSAGFVEQINNITWSSYTINSVFNGWQENTTYFWYIVATDSFGLKRYSTTWYFITNEVEEPPLSNFLISPGTTIYQTLSPQNHVVFSLHPTFYWTISFDPDPFNKVYYQVFVSSYSDTPNELNSIFYTTSKIYTTYYYLAENVLEDNTTYFWQLRVWDEPYSGYAVYSSTVFWFYTYTQNTPPQPSVLLFPPDGYTTSYFYINFTWQNGVDVGYNAYISSHSLIYWTETDTTVISGLPASTTFYSITTPLKNNATYYWKVISYDNGYPPPQLSTSSLTYKFYIKNSSPTTFSLLAPANGSIVETQSVQLFWTNSIEPDGESLLYKVVYSTDNFKSFVSYLNVSQTNFTISNLQDNTTYWWFVVAYDTWGFSTCSSLTFYFIVDSIPTSPENFNLIAPFNNSILYNTYTTFYWEQTFDKDPFESITYELIIATSSNFSNIVFSTKTPQTSFYLPLGVLNINTTYYWTVKAVSIRSGETQATNSPYRFIIYNTAPTKPSLVQPVNNVVVNISSITFVWSLSVDFQNDEFFYELYIATTQTWVKLTTTTQNFYQYNNFLDDTTYFWYVKVIDFYGNSNLSDTYMFVTSYSNAPPSKPKILNPQNNQTINLPYTITWTTSTDTDIYDTVNYRLEISTTQNFSSYVIVTTQTVNYFLLDNLYLSAATYYVRVVSFDKNNSETSSEVIKFFIPEYKVEIYTPQNNEVVTYMPYEIKFSKVEPVVSFDTITYVISISTYQNFEYKKEIVSQNTYYVLYPSFVTVATYYLYIQVFDNFDRTTKSDTNKFIITSTPPPAPKNIILSTSTLGVIISWQDTKTADFLEYRVYRGVDLTKEFYLIEKTTSTNYIDKVDILSEYFYTVKTVNYFGIESVDNIYVKLQGGTQSDFYYSQDGVVLVSVPKTEGLNVVNIEKLPQEEKAEVIYVYNITADKLKTEKFVNIKFLKPQTTQYISIEFFDGINWINIPYLQEYDKVSFDTHYLGKYRLKVTPLLNDTLTIIGTSPQKRIITPNNDGKNDYIEFIYKPDTFIEGELYDINMKKICKLKRKSNNILYFDGKKDEKLLPPGVYIFVISAKPENKTFIDTLIIKY